MVFCRVDEASHFPVVLIALSDYFPDFVVQAVSLVPGGIGLSVATFAFLPDFGD